MINNIHEKLKNIEDVIKNIGNLIPEESLNELNQFCSKIDDKKFLTEYVARQNFEQVKNISYKFCQDCVFSNLKIFDYTGKSEHKTGDKESKGKNIGDKRTRNYYLSCQANKEQCSSKDCQRTKYRPMVNTKLSRSGFAINKYAKIIYDKAYRPSEIVSVADCEYKTAQGQQKRFDKLGIYKIVGKKAVAYNVDNNSEVSKNISKLQKLIFNLKANISDVETSLVQLENDFLFREAFIKATAFYS